MKEYKIVDLFAGLGGMRRGFELSGRVEVVGSAEIDPWACKTYKWLYREDPLGDVSSEEFKSSLGSFDILLGGFSCQPFSIAGKGAGFEDQDYINAGAQVVYSLEEILGRADLVLKFARPLRDELEVIRPGCALAGFLHLAAARQDKIEIMKEKGLTIIAYEQIEDDDGYHPVRAPLSQIGGRMVVQIAGRLMQNDHGGRGILLGGSAGVPSAEIVGCVSEVILM